MDIFSALAVPTRRRIMEILSLRGELSATDIADMFDISPPAISQHLKILREAQLVKVEKRGQRRVYQINPDTLIELERWTKKMAEQWNERFDKLEKLLKVKTIKLHHKKYGK